MLRLPIAVLALAVLSPALARAQIDDITTGRPPGANGPNFNVLGGAYERPMSAADMRAQEFEQDYRRTLAKIPDKRPSRDPWSGIRAATPADRHRPQ